MAKIRRVALLIVTLLCAVSLSAQMAGEVRWTASVEKTSANAGKVVLKAAIPSGWHIYGMELPDEDTQATEFSFESNDVDFTGAVTPSVPAGMHHDAMLEIDLTWWEGSVTFTRDFRLKPGVSHATIKCSVAYMACTEQSCTRPTTKEFTLTFQGEATAAAAAPAPVAPVVATPAEEESPEVAVADTVTAPAPAQAPVALTEVSDLWAPVDIEAADATSAAIAESSLFVIFIFGFLGGLLALLTPCVWPMIPMTVSFFLKKGKSRRRAISDAITYALSIVIIYLVLGIAITMIFGAGKLNEVATSAVFNLLFFALLVVFAISFFGAFDIKLPARWSNAVDSKAEATTGVISIFFMAFTLVLVSFSCTGPIIGTLLVEAASDGSILGPAIGMGGFAIGLALPFGVFAFFPTLLKEMPRSGGWLNTVKVVLGFVELILSLKFLSVADLAYDWRILDREVFLALWIVLFALLGMYLLGKIRFPHDDETTHVSVPRFFMALASFSFAVYLLPGLWGAPLKVTSAFTPPLTTQDFNLYGGTFTEFHDYDEGMRYARDNKMPVIVDFSGYACVNCRKMEGAVFDTPEVRSIIEKNYVLIKLMVDEKASLPEPQQVMENGSPITLRTVGDRWSYLQRYKFSINSQPYYVILDNNGKPLEAPRAYDEDLNKFVNWLESGLNNYKNSK